MTFNTGNPIGSTDARDRSDNSENLDLAVNSLSQTFVDRLGVTRDTLEGIYQKSAYYRAGTFDAGYTLTNNRQTLAYGNVEYSWSGLFPKVVAVGSTPETTGGVGVGAWVDKTDLTLRSELSNGALLVRNSLWSLRDFVSVKDFGAVGDGVTDDTESINFCLTQCVGAEIFFPAGVYKYSGGGVLGDGTTIRGAGRTNTVILTPIPNPTFLFNCAGFGSGIENIKITTSVTQTSGSWVLLSGIESYISNFYMNFDFNGILMTGVAARIRHGRMQDGAVGAIRIRAEGGDTSQCIDDVIMGAQTPANISQAGIRVRNSSALMITNTSIIQQGVGLLIDPASPADNVFSLYVSKCFFDNGTYGIKVAPTGGAGLYRSRFTDVWASSSSNDGVYLNSGTSNTISGVYFESCHCVLNAGAGFTTGTGCADISIRGGLYAQNTFGMYINAVLKLKITEATIGTGGGLLANSSSGIVLTTVTDQFLISDNIIVGNPSAIVDESTGTFRHISRNIGFITSTTGTATILAGNTTVVVNHGLNSTPLLSEITLTRGSGNAGSTDLYADSVTASQFTIHTALAPSSNMTIYFTIRTKGS